MNATKTHPQLYEQLGRIHGSLAVLRCNIKSYECNVVDKASAREMKQLWCEAACAADKALTCLGSRIKALGFIVPDTTREALELSFIPSRPGVIEPQTQLQNAVADGQLLGEHMRSLATQLLPIDVGTAVELASLEVALCCELAKAKAQLGIVPKPLSQQLASLSAEKPHVMQKLPMAQQQHSAQRADMSV